jgi:hypothetical protein
VKDVAQDETGSSITIYALRTKRRARSAGAARAAAIRHLGVVSFRSDGKPEPSRLACCLGEGYADGMRLGVVLAFLGAGACSAGGPGGAKSSTGVQSGAVEPESLSGSPDNDAGDDLPDVWSGAALSVGASSCPARGNAASCSPLPAALGIPSAAAGAPALPAAGTWVGCETTVCASATACETCTCVALAGGATWQCAKNSGFQPLSDAPPVSVCALNSGPLDADVGDVGPVEYCTPQFPTCTAPFPGSAGWQCCVHQSVGNLSESACMPNDAGAYSGSPRPI